VFAQRLKWFCYLLMVVALVVIARLVDIQVLHADEYELLAARSVTPAISHIRAPRGSILDRDGAVLVSDEPAADICVAYKLLAGEERYLKDVARLLRAEGRYAAPMSDADVVADLRRQIPEMWRRLSELSGVPVPELIGRSDRQFARVETIRENVRRVSPAVRAVREENELLPIVEDVDDSVALAARLELEQYPWLRVIPGSRRVAHDADPVVHVLGRVAAASRERIDQDEFAGDELRRLLPGDRCGVSGVERLAEDYLRGARGRIVQDIDRREIERLDPARGEDVRLTIDLELQRRVLRVLEEAVGECPTPAGAAAVIIDVATRDVLALASYPYYAYEDFNTRYAELRRDTRRLPLLFRAVQAQYPPGSTCKAITLVAGLTEGVISAGSRIHCTGFLLPENPTVFRCWIYNQFPGVTHDIENPDGLDAESAIRNSCNIYFFRIGDRLGPERLCDWFTRFGLGRPQGTGLIEESPAIVPSETWLWRFQSRAHQAADVWNYAIGQGEVTATPLQAASVAATIAAGFWAPATVVRDASGRRIGPPASAAPRFDEHAMRVLRAGMWRVVNERGGTAHYARLEREDYELCGKTGSAQAAPRAVSYRYMLEWPYGRREETVAASREDALGALAASDGQAPRIVESTVAERYPELVPGEKLPSHAWFIGFCQPKSTRRGEPPTGRVYAISVLIEFGGGGGRVAGPVAKRIMESVLERE
jgi:penicillin-binding protein 2